MLYLRIASVIALLQFAAHTTLVLRYQPKHGPDEVNVVQTMKAHEFRFGGFAKHSYWDMYVGYALFAAFNCLVEAVLFWQLAGMMSTTNVRPILALFLAANVVYALLVARYFFLLPLYADVAVAVCLGIAIAGAPRVTHATAARPRRDDRS